MVLTHHNGWVTRVSQYGDRLGVRDRVDTAQLNVNPMTSEHQHKYYVR
jgi:hypothetical protein